MNVTVLVFNSSRTSLRISIGSAKTQKKLCVSFGHVPHAVYIFA